MLQVVTGLDTFKHAHSSSMHTYYSICSIYQTEQLIKAIIFSYLSYIIMCVEVKEGEEEDEGEF